VCGVTVGTVRTHAFLCGAKIRQQEFGWSPICGATPGDA